MTSPEKFKHDRLMRIYKKSLTAFLADIWWQGGGCAICDKPFPQYRAFQDHWHACCPRRLKEYCGKCNRGILCYTCNKFVVGIIEKQHIPVDRLLAYLKHWEPILQERGAYDKKSEPAITPQKKSRKRKDCL